MHRCRRLSIFLTESRWNFALTFALNIFYELIFYDTHLNRWLKKAFLRMEGTFQSFKCDFNWKRYRWRHFIKWWVLLIILMDFFCEYFIFYTLSMSCKYSVSCFNEIDSICISFSCFLLSDFSRNFLWCFFFEASSEYLNIFCKKIIFLIKHFNSFKFTINLLAFSTQTFISEVYFPLILKFYKGINNSDMIKIYYVQNWHYFHQTYKSQILAIINCTSAKYSFDIAPKLRVGNKFQEGFWRIVTLKHLGLAIGR